MMMIMTMNYQWCRLLRQALSWRRSVRLCVCHTHAPCLSRRTECGVITLAGTLVRPEVTLCQTRTLIPTGREYLGVRATDKICIANCEPKDCISGANDSGSCCIATTFGYMSYLQLWGTRQRRQVHSSASSSSLELRRRSRTVANLLLRDCSSLHASKRQLAE